MRHTQCWPLLSDILILFGNLHVTFWDLLTPLSSLVIVMLAQLISSVIWLWCIPSPALPLRGRRRHLYMPLTQLAGSGIWSMGHDRVGCQCGNRSRIVQRSPLLCAPGLVKFVPAVARLSCLALPGSFLTMFAQNKGNLCRIISKFATHPQKRKCQIFL